MNDKQRALESAQRAVELDRNNIQAVLILKKLKSTKDVPEQHRPKHQPALKDIDLVSCLETLLGEVRTELNEFSNLKTFIMQNNLLRPTVCGYESHGLEDEDGRGRNRGYYRCVSTLQKKGKKKGLIGLVGKYGIPSLMLGWYVTGKKNAPSSVPPPTPLGFGQAHIPQKPKENAAKIACGVLMVMSALYFVKGK
eukprot:TRINITY_DN10025_c0_g2_i2.p1 TRINITY_DN10025_c0_g2~~TRINITY_DN10025_c0_g2_i2.p1  ORF type:complete len:195 (+),score=38.33 TRINITY_DN10025_c0_g2_i2:111-695(+)